MSVPSNLTIREATLDEDSLIAKHFYQLWLDNNIPANDIEPDWMNLTPKFITQARQELDYQAFVAEVQGQVVGSTSCQRFAGLYPSILIPRQFGYIWGVYVETAFRQQGIGKCLTETALHYLKQLGCTRAILHASPLGKPIYTRLGFVENNEMRLDLT